MSKVIEWTFADCQACTQGCIDHWRSKDPQYAWHLCESCTANIESLKQGVVVYEPFDKTGENKK